MFVLLLLTLVVQTESTATWRCNGRLIDTGLTRLTVQRRCGEPVHVSYLPIRQEVDVVGGDGLTSVQDEVLELWVYAPAGRLVRVVEIRRGQVSKVTALERLDASDTNACKRGVYPLGVPAGVIRASCGQPADLDRWREMREGVTVSGQQARRLVTFERWVYDLGPGKLLRALTFENGLLRSVEQRERSLPLPRP